MIRTLGKQELDHIAIGAISAYEIKRAELERAEELNDSIHDIFA
jgi:hypothetical protein